MLTLEERLMIGLKVLEKLRPRLRALRPQGEGPLSEEISPEGASSENTFPLDVSSLAAGDLIEGVAAEAPSEHLFEVPTLEWVLEQVGSLSPYSLVLGLCDDGLPFVLDLTNPAPGALLITGEASSGKTRLLKAILASVIRINAPDQVPFSVIATQPDEYLSLADADHCQQLNGINESEINDLIHELAGVVEERRKGGSQGPVYLLAIDDLASLVQSLDELTYARLYWLIRHGPRSRVWTIATLSTERAAELDVRFLEAFRTRLLGFMTDADLAISLSGDSNFNMDDLRYGFEFCVPYGQDWLRFSICEPEGS
jgi:FtsK/SpoIIIE family